MSPDLQKLIDLSSDVLVILSSSGQIVVANRAFLNLVDEPHFTLERKPMLNFIAQQDQAQFQDAFHQPAYGKTPKVVQARLINRHHTYLQLVWNLSPPDEHGHVYLKGQTDTTISLGQDLPKLGEHVKELGQHLREQTEQYAGAARELAGMISDWVDPNLLISHYVTEIVCLHHPDNGKYVFVSPSLESYVGYKPNEILGKRPVEFFHPDDAEKLTPKYELDPDHEGPFGKLQYRFKHKTSGYRWMETVRRNIRNAAGEVIFVLSTTRDIHEQKVENDQRETLFKYYKILANKTPNGAVLLLDRSSRYLIAEGAELKRLGRGDETYVGKYSYDIFDERGKRELQPYLDLVLKGEPVKFEFQNLDHHYAVLGEPYFNDQGDVLNGIILVQNITETKQFEAKLRQIVYELNFQKSALDICAYVSISDQEGIITYVNDRLCQISGYKIDELLGHDHGLFNSHYHPDSYWRDMYKTLNEGKVWHGEIKNRKKTGEYFWTDTYIVPFKNAKGIITQYVAIRFDVTQRKLMEEDLKAKNFELDSFVYHASHDLRAPLTSILGLVNITLLEEDREKMKQYARMIQESILRLDEFIKAILTYSQNSNREQKYLPIDFQLLIKEHLQEVQYLKNYQMVDVTTEIRGEHTFYSDPLRLDIIFKNLIANAIKYADVEKKDYCFLKIKVLVTEEYAQMLFEDNGQGISREYQDRVFDMFYRANEGSDGSGLGLYIVKQTIDRLGGIIRLQSQPNRGTIFTIEVPNLPVGRQPDTEVEMLE